MLQYLEFWIMIYIMTYQKGLSVEEVNHLHLERKFHFPPFKWVKAYMTRAKPENRFIEKELWWATVYLIYFLAFAANTVTENIFFYKSALPEYVATGKMPDNPN